MNAPGRPGPVAANSPTVLAPASARGFEPRPGDPDVLSLDIIEVRNGATALAWETRVTADWAGHPVSVVSREGLIALKRLRGSAQDMADIATVEPNG